MPYCFAALARARQPGGSLGTHGRNQAGEMQDAYAFLAEDALHIELVDGKGAAHFTCSVVPDPGRPETEAGIRDIELMTIAPGPP